MRLASLLGNLISPNQWSFVKERWIAENTVLAQEVIHKLKKKGEKMIDAHETWHEKGIWQIRMEFYYLSLEGLGFQQSFKILIYSCVNSVSFSLLFNGNITGNIRPDRSICQGDPLSPLLLILFSEVLTRLLAREECSGRFHGIKISRGAPMISHLMYTDDLLIIGKASS